MLTLLGIGICAINIAKWLGAEIYATVGNEEKASFLVKEFGIPRKSIFNSRDNSFLPGIMEATNGLGVDLVLNTLSGELLSTSWKCVAADGAMVELGKRDSEHFDLPNPDYHTNIVTPQWLVEDSSLWHPLRITGLSLEPM